mmetsp:Transcript_9335/g.18423  ORF Transcript_9335/g.18423 Transcript_9335/m.18423 type:complete len:251 (+) Transcript_9335:735-1487(+)
MRGHKVNFNYASFLSSFETEAAELEEDLAPSNNAGPPSAAAVEAEEEEADIGTPEILASSGRARPAAVRTSITSTVTLSIDPCAKASCVRISAPSCASLQLSKRRPTSLLFTTSQRPSVASTKYISSGPHSHSLNSGSGMTYSFKRRSPIARETARIPSTRQTPQCTTEPPNFAIRSRSSLRSGLWSLDNGSTWPFRCTSTARESPALATTKVLPWARATRAVVPSSILRTCAYSKNLASIALNACDKAC